VEAPAASTALAADGSTPPPWAIEGCAACKGNGFNTQGNACRICDIKSQKAGKPKSQDFSFDSSEPGMVIWQHKTDPNLAGISPLPGSLAPAPKTTERASKPPAAPAEAPKAETQTPPPAPAEIPATEPAATGKGPGRPRKGFIFCVNCTPCTGEGREGSGRAIHRLDKYLLEAQTKLAADGGKESFYELDAFKRRDALAAMIPAFADAFGSDIVVALGVRNGTEMATLVDGLRPLAGMEIIAAM
jgi:hypothetical protein